MANVCAECKWSKMRGGKVLCYAPRIVKAAKELGIKENYVDVTHWMTGPCHDFIAL